MTYLQFHLVFIVPPLLLLGWRIRRVFPALGRRAPWALPLILLVAFIYTTPWDNYLVWKEVWGYPAERVLARIGYVPVEEYMFFLLQPAIAGMFFYRLLARRPGAAPAPASPLAVRLIGALPWIVASAAGVWLLTFESGTYLGLILAWAAPVVALQWLYMGPAIWRLRRAVLPAIALPTVYLWFADWYAINQGIWYISERFTLGWNPAGLPVEEATFFFITNVLVVFGTVLFLAPGLPHLDPSPVVKSARKEWGPAAPAGMAALLLGGVLLAGCGGDAPAPGPGGGGNTEDGDRIIVPGERVGALTSSTSETAIRERLGADRVRQAEIPIGEGFCYPGTLLYPDTPDEVEVTWSDPGRTRPGVVRVEGVGSAWATDSGIRVGSGLDELHMANGGPFLFTGFGWDYGGRVVDWLEGQVDPRPVEGRPALIVILDADSLGVLLEREDESVPGVMGDRTVRSDLPGLPGIGLRVLGFEVMLGPEPEASHPCVGPDGIGSGVGGPPPGS